MSSRTRWSLVLITVLGLCTPGLAHAATGVDDNYSTVKDTPLTVAAPGLLSNDTCGLSCKVATVNDQAFQGQVTFSPAPDGDYGPLPSGATLTVSDDGSITYDPTTLTDPVNTTSDSFTYTATDYGGSSATTTVTISLTDPPASSPPVANGDQYSVELGSVLTVAAPGVLGNDTDADGDPLAVALINGSPSGVGTAVALSYGMLTLQADGSFTYEPNAGAAAGLDEGFSYTASDGTNTSNSALVGLSLTESTSGDTTVMVRFDDVAIVSLDEEVGRNGINRLALGTTNGAVAQVTGAGLPSQTQQVVLESAESLTAADAAEILHGCERMGLVAQSQPAKYDLVVQIDSAAPSTTFSVGGDGEVTIDLSQTRVLCWVERVTGSSAP